MKDPIPGSWLLWAGVTGGTFLLANMFALVYDVTPGGSAPAIDIGYAFLAVAAVGCVISVAKFFDVEYFAKRRNLPPST